MKILIIQPWISYRGAETISVQQAYYLQKFGHEAKIAAIFVNRQKLPVNGNKVKYLLPPKFLSALCQKSRLFLFFLGPILLFFIVLKHASSFEILNPHNLPGVWIAVLIAKIFNKKVIWTVHSVPRKVSWRNKKDLFEYFVWVFGASAFDLWAVSQVDKIIAVSDLNKKLVYSRYKRHATVLNSGIGKVGGTKKDLPKVVLELRKKSKLLLLSVGILHPQKKPLLILEALTKLREIEPTAVLIFVGDGPEKPVLQEYILKHNLQNSVYFAGFVPQDKLAGYYQICDIHVMPSIRESFGGTTLEALSLGKISIISSDSGVKDIIKDYVLTCESNSSSVFQKIKVYMDKRKYYEQKGVEGKIYINKVLNWENYCQKFISLAREEDDKEVTSTVYNKGYYEIHYEKEHEALQIERETRLQRAIKLLEVQPGMKVLDLGCGNGELCSRLAALGAEVYGIDYSTDGIKLAKNRLAKLPAKIKKLLHLYNMDAKHLKFQDNYFDRIVSIDVFEHIYPEPLRQVISEIKRVIKPNGKLVIETAPNLFFLGPVSFLVKKIMGWKKFESDEYHINVYDYFRFKKELAQIPGDISVRVLNDSHQFFYSRIWRMRNAPQWIKSLAQVVDYLHENPLSEAIILRTPLQIFLAHDLWGVVTVRKRAVSSK